jgi:hypothetical protein
VRVFYDEDKSVELWGEELPESFDDVFRNQCEYCVMFISKEYAAKPWTNHERKSALARAVRENKTYVLPVRFDDTELPGFRPSVLYQDARNIKPGQLSGNILKKLGRAPGQAKAQTSDQKPSFRLPKPKKEIINSYKSMSQLIDGLVGALKTRGDQLEQHGTAFYYAEKAGRHIFRFGNTNGAPTYSLDIWMGAHFQDDSLGVYGTRGRPTTGSDQTTNGLGRIVAGPSGHPEIDYDGIGDNQGRSSYTTEQFIELIWNEVVDHLES